MDGPPGVACMDTRHPRRLLAPEQVLMRFSIIYDRPSLSSLLRCQQLVDLIEAKLFRVLANVVVAQVPMQDRLSDGPIGCVPDSAIYHLQVLNLLYVLLAQQRTIGCHLWSGGSRDLVDT